MNRRTDGLTEGPVGGPTNGQTIQLNNNARQRIITYPYVTAAGKCKKKKKKAVQMFLVACYATTSRCRFVARSVGWSVPFLLFRRFLGFWAHSSVPNAIISQSKSF